MQKNKTTDAQSEVLQLPDWNYNGIAQVEGTNHTFVAKSFVQYLKDSGYHTIHCGKAHWGAIDTPGENPATSALKRTLPVMRQADWLPT